MAEMNEKPKRIQRKRERGWKMPENAISVTRPGKWGNPFKVGVWFKKLSNDWRVWTHGDTAYFGTEQVRDLEHSLELFADYAPKRLTWQRDWLEPLRGHDLACWCAPSSKCHADILLKLANPEPTKCQHPSPSLADFCDDCGRWI